MDRYALLLTQNTDDGGGVEFQEKEIVLKKGELLTGELLLGGDPVVLAVPDTNAEGKILTLKEVSGEIELSWEEPASINDLPGTDENSFYIGGSTNGGFIHKTPSSGAVSDMEFKNNAGSLIPIKVGTPSHNDHAIPKSYADGLLAANDAMVYKGTIGTGGDVTALPTTHGTGWTYRVIEAGTYAGKVCEEGDLIISLVDRSGVGNVDADWSVVQANIDGAVTGPAGAIGTETIAVWNSNNRSLKDGGELISAFVKRSDFTGTQSILGTNGTAGSPVNINADDAYTVLGYGFGDDISFRKVLPAFLDLADYSIPGKAGTMTPANISAGENTILGRESSGSLAFSTVKTAQIGDAQVSLAKMADLAEKSIIGNNTAASATPLALSVAQVAEMVNVGTIPSSNTEGTKGQIRVDDDYVYFCVSTGNQGSAKWKRLPLSNWTA
jgi:hypothetical protein